LSRSGMWACPTEEARVTTLEVRVLGGLEATLDGAPVELGARKQRAVFAVLALEADRIVSDDRLIDLLWGDDQPKATASLRSYVSNLRRALEPDRRPRDPARLLLTQGPGYRLAIAPDAVDAHRFEALAGTVRSRLLADDPSGALDVAADALALWAGPPLPELADERFVVDAAGRLETARVGVLEAVAEARLALGDHLGATEAIEPVASAHPLRERPRALLALALYRAGRQADALRALADARRVLADAAGLDPGPELRKLEADILEQAPSLDWVPPRVAATVTAPPIATGPAAPALGGAVLTPPNPSAPADRPVGGLSIGERSPAGGAGSGPGHPAPAGGAGGGPGHPAPAGDDGVAITGATVGGLPLLGRDRELEALERALAAAVAGRGGAAALIGEAGIGKTRLVEELAARARDMGAAVAWARCPESGAMPSYWPAVQLAEQLREVGLLEARLNPPPELADRAAADAARFAIDRAVLAAMRSMSVPLMLVIDDVHWADPDSLRLLEHVAADLGQTRTLVVITTRPVGPDAPEALVDCLAEVARAGGLQLVLGGLERAAVADWLAFAGGGDAPAREIVEALHERTEGNPLFLHELVELLATEGRLGTHADATVPTVPPGVQFVVRRRVSRLPSSTQRLLSVASVVGRCFDVAVLADVAGDSALATLELLEPALAAGLVQPDGAGFRFSHALVADALSAEVNPARRAHIHAATASALDARPPAVADAGAALVAHHALAGAVAGTAELAVEASRRAARHAAARLAHEDAAGHWDRVAAALELARPDDLAARAEAHLEAGSARLWVDLIDPGKASILRAIELAGRAGDQRLMARAAAQLALPSIWPQQEYGVTDPDVVDALERVLAALPEEWGAERAETRSALALALAYHADTEHFWEVSRQAVAEAEATGDPGVIARVLVSHLYSLWRATALEERIEVAGRVVDLVEDHGLHPALAVVGRYHLALAEQEAADLDTAQRTIDASWAVIDRAGGTNRAQMLWTQAGMHVARGRYDEAARLGQEAYELYRRTRGHQTELIAMVCTLAVAVDRGGLEELLDTLDEMSADIGGYGRGFTEIFAMVLCEVGRLDEARAVVAPFVDVTDNPDDWTWCWIMAAAAHVRADLGDAPACAELAAVLEPYRGRWVTPGSGTGSFGLVDLALARALATAGDADGARKAFATAVAGHEALRTPAWLARALAHQAVFLASTGDADDRAAAEAAAQRARALAEDHGFPYVLRRLDALPL
jgi:DNA-binding SARP family transcriptional activator